MSKSDKTGTREWAETTVNIARGCEHNCRYCYSRHSLVDRYKIVKPENWTKMTVDQAKVKQNRRYCQGLIMYPSAHDITPSILNESLGVLRKLLEAGNYVLIVSKPHRECIETICDTFEEYKRQILFRFTIGAVNDEVLSFWEPLAPKFQERLHCLQYAYTKGFATSVSCEPYLDTSVENTYTACRKFITDSFWIGKLRHFNSRVKLDDATAEQIKKYVESLKAALSDEFVAGIYHLLNGQPFIQWKDSIREVMEK